MMAAMMPVIAAAMSHPRLGPSHRSPARTNADSGRAEDGDDERDGHRLVAHGALLSYALGHLSAMQDRFATGGR